VADVRGGTGIIRELGRRQAIVATSAISRKILALRRSGAPALAQEARPKNEDVKALEHASTNSSSAMRSPRQVGTASAIGVELIGLIGIEIAPLESGERRRVFTEAP